MELKIISIDKIRPSPLQPREHFDKEKIKELGKSILKWGLIQPIVVNPSKDGYTIIAGERRWRAMKIFGIKKTRAIVKNIKYDQFLVESLIENIHRENLTDTEKVRALEEIRRINKIPKERDFIKQLSGIVEISERTIASWFDSAEVRKKIGGGPKLTQSVISETISLPDNEREKVLKKAMEKEWGGRKVRKLVSAIKKSPEPIKEAILEGDLEPDVVEEIVKIEEPEIQKEVLKKAKNLSPVGIRSYIESLKKSEEKDLELVGEIEVHTMLCPKCNQKLRIIHKEPKGHRLEEIL